jgi:hypothetical protein
VDDIVERSLTSGIFSAVVTATIEDRLQQQIEEHLAEASEAALASVATGVSFEEHAALKELVDGHNLARTTLEATVQQLHDRLDEHEPKHADHLQRHSVLQGHHATLRNEHEALKGQVAQLLAEQERSSSRATPADGDDEVGGVSAEVSRRRAQQVAEHAAATERHAVELAAAKEARDAMESQLAAMHTKVELLVSQLVDHTAVREEHGKRHDEHETGIKSLDSSLQDLQSQIAASASANAEASALKTKLAERKASRMGTDTSAAAGTTPAWASVKEKLKERRKEKDDHRARLEEEHAAAAAAAATAAAADAEERDSADADAGAKPKPRRQSKVSLLVPNPQWDVELLKKHAMEGFAKFLKTNHFRVVDLFNSMDRNKDNLLSSVVHTRAASTHPRPRTHTEPRFWRGPFSPPLPASSGRPDFSFLTCTSAP